MAEHELWFARPANVWTEALPLGNGRIGAMAYGRVEEELIHLNDATAWSGTPDSEHRHGDISAETAEAALTAARRALEAGDFTAAETAMLALQHRYSQTFLPFADLQLRTGLPGSVSGYRRSLDLAAAMHTVRYDIDGHETTVRSYVSHPHRVLVIEFTTAHPAGVSLALELTSKLRISSRHADEHEAWLQLHMPSDVAPSHDIVETPVEWSDDESLSLQGCVGARWSHDGTSTGSMAASGVRRARVLVGTDTTFGGMGLAPQGTGADAVARVTRHLDSVGALSSERLEAAHHDDFSRLYDRASLDTGEASAEPTDVRLISGNANPAGVLDLDPSLAGLLFNFGRYLLISSSRAGGPPANLQGIWNAELRPPWSSNYTTNINVQMNYWQAELTGLAECAEPYYDLVDVLRASGEETARRLYGAPGWVAHHNTDIWGYSQPVGLGVADPKWAFWPLAGAWMVRELWEHLLFGADDDFARERAWPAIRGVAEFSLHWLQERPDGSLGTLPSTSPENQFQTSDGPRAVAESATLDLTLIRDVLGMVVTLAERLALRDDPVVASARAVLPRIPGVQVSPDGLVREWHGDLSPHDPQHRHVSPLYFLHPSDNEVNAELAAAASRTLDVRGDESTGWSLVWKIAMRARLRQAGKVDDLLSLVFRDMEVDRGDWVGGLYPNLLAAHPPFQIDGNLGFVSGIAEALLQSHRGEIELLPALPASLNEGSVRGLVARPGVLVSLWWRAGTLVRAELTSRRPGSHVVRYGDHEVTIELDGMAVLTIADFGG